MTVVGVGFWNGRCSLCGCIAAHPPGYANDEQAAVQSFICACCRNACGHGFKMLCQKPDCLAARVAEALAQ